MILFLSKVSIIMHILAILWVSCALIMVLVILIQKGRGGGLSGAFGGGMAGGLLGSKTGDFLTWVTVTLVGVFLLLSIALARFYKPQTVSEAVNAPATQAQAQPTTTDTPELPDETDLDIEVNIP